MKLLGRHSVLNSLVYNELNKTFSCSKQSLKYYSNIIKLSERNNAGQVHQVYRNNFNFIFPRLACTQLCSCIRFHSSLVNPGFNSSKTVQSNFLSSDVRALTAAPRLPLYYQQLRMKSNKKKRVPGQSNAESDSDSDDDALTQDDFEAPEKFKMMKIHTASMRTDAIISNSLDVSRNRLEEAFYGPGLLLNGTKMLKKSTKMEEGDYVDLVVDKLDDQLKVKRVKIIKIYSEKTSTEKLHVKVRVWKAPFLVKNPDDGRRSS